MTKKKIKLVEFRPTGFDVLLKEADDSIGEIEFSTYCEKYVFVMPGTATELLEEELQEIVDALKELNFVMPGTATELQEEELQEVVDTLKELNEERGR